MVVELHRPFRGFSSTFDTAVRDLDSDARDAFIAIDIRGLTVREASIVLGRSRSDIDRLAQRARLTLKGELS